MPDAAPLDIDLGLSEQLDTTAGTVISFGEPEEEAKPEAAFGDNLASLMEESALRVLGAELVRKYDADKVSRSDWERTYTEGLELLGLRIVSVTDPWPGACGAFHPILTEAAVRFQAQAITEIWPATGPCRTKIVGKTSPELDKQAGRVEDDMNLCVTERMPEYRPEMERLLFNLPLTGSAFKKVYQDPYLKRPCAMYVPAEDLIVGYGATDLASCERYTHVMKRTEGEVRRLVRSGFWRDVDLPKPIQRAERTDEMKDKIAGISPNQDTDDRYTVLEMYIDMDLPEFSEEGMFVPYVVTIDYSSNEVLAIRRNWEEGDPNFLRRQHMVAYHYIPGIGFYGLGLFHLIGGVAKAATVILRQLIDAGTLATLPAGLKTKGLRIKNEDQPLRPAEWRDVDVPGDDISKALMPLPYKEPSKVLYDLMMNLVEEARRLASIPDINIGDMKQEAPVGTTLALLERAMKVMTGISARLHASLGQELKILAALNVQTWPTYDFDIGGEDPAIKQKDFDGRIDVIPVSDPNAASMSQRVMLYAAQGQLVAQAPHIYDLPEFHRQAASALGFRDVERIIPSSRDLRPTDPVTENQNILSGKPIKVFQEQDHDAHIRVHLAAVQDPKIVDIVSQSPMAASIQGAAESHIREHIGFKYRYDLQKQLGVDLPPYGEQLPPEVENRLSNAMAKAAEKLLAKDVAEKILEEKLKEANDPLSEIQRKELEIKERDLARKERADEARVKQDAAVAVTRTAIDIARLEQKQKSDEDYIQSEIVKEAMRSQSTGDGRQQEGVLRAAELGVRAAEVVINERSGTADRRIKEGNRKPKE